MEKGGVRTGDFDMKVVHPPSASSRRQSRPPMVSIRRLLTSGEPCSSLRHQLGDNIQANVSRSRKRGEMRCFWCDKDFEHLTDDHIVPQSLGGTLDFKVQSCDSCQTRLSRAEREVARKSILAIHALASPIRPRHPDRPTSGHLQPSFLLVKNPLGGYCESLLSRRKRCTRWRTSRRRLCPERHSSSHSGLRPGEAQLLLDLYRKALRLDEKLGPGELVCELTANLELDPEVASDPEFWPRMVLLPGNRIMFRARDPQELVRCAKVLEIIARSAYQIDPSKWEGDVQITAGTEHKIGLHFDPQCVRRIAAKTAYALFCKITRQKIHALDDERIAPIFFVAPRNESLRARFDHTRSDDMDDFQ